MRQQTALIPTLRDVGAEAEVMSHRLMLKAGMIKQLAAGIYTLLPLGHRVLRKVEQIVREEMEQVGAQELLLPAMNPSELWKESGRWETYGAELVKLVDRHERDFLLGPTHEEVITDLLRNTVSSYKKLPLTLYQIQTKFRDERRPRSGVLRGREFLMKDAYSFHADEESLEKTYQMMYDAYSRIFTRCGLEFRPVEADAGAIGGTGTHEFMALSSAGEDTLVFCRACDYAANIEMAEVQVPKASDSGLTVAPLEKVATPGAKSIEQVTNMLGIEPAHLIKSLLFIVDGEPVMVLVRGDHEVNDIKVKNFLEAEVCELATEEMVQQVTGAPVGFAGPIGLQKEIRILVDHTAAQMKDAVVGANEGDTHLKHVDFQRDVLSYHVADVRLIEEGDVCPQCGDAVSFTRGIEVGQVFKLGTKYSKPMNAVIHDPNGKEIPMTMGCYGVGISRTVASIVEQHHDDDGIVWPLAIAPYAVHLIVVNVKNDEQRDVAEELYASMQAAGVEVLFDDRKERAGVKFKDADLLGIPVRITVGAKVGDGLVEYKVRRSGESGEISKTDVMEQLPQLLKQVAALTKRIKNR
ncbi:proline--tRNA ligase [Mechercharimyces sp. CAU 1602]|uniref:proline--tRNA ligase n=1 Tax=Mechercharimyces sp. CAU 1602 TaxID=2973933 RepID=UPI00216336C4|nr:proline--tRNA ligase [Mechercharimyces sp. CAU 1602]MCS1351296.1 proline--tRNA ligase [Mechercharimyces sp. CAU 1602]